MTQRDEAALSYHPPISTDKYETLENRDGDQTEYTVCPRNARGHNLVTHWVTSTVAFDLGDVR